KDTLRETLAQDGLAPYIIMAEEMGEEYSPTEIAAAAFKLLLGVAPPHQASEEEDSLARPDEADTVSEKPRSRPGRERGQFEAEQGMTRLYLNIGREDGVRPGDIVGALANEADIPGRSIGAIELYDRFSLVDVPSHQAQQVLRALKKTRIRNQVISAGIAEP